jgi:hypothetical protein
VLLAQDGAVKLSDFGVAVLSTGEAPTLQGSLDTRAAQEEAQAGTLEYMAPELRRGAEPTPASDLYSLGVVLYRCLAGRLPRSLQPPSHFNPEVPPALDRVVARLLDPVEERYQSAAGVLIDLEDCLAAPEGDPFEPAATDTAPASDVPATRAEMGGAFLPRNDVLGWGELPYAVCVIALAAVAVNFRVVSPLLAISLVTGLFLITVGASKFSRAPLAAGVFWAGWAIVFLGPKRPMFLFVSIGVAAVIFGALLWLSQLVFRSRRPQA